MKIITYFYIDSEMITETKMTFLNMKKVAKFHQNNQYTKLSHSDVKEACSSSS